MRVIRYLLVSVFLVIAMTGCLHCQKNKDVLFQISTIGALLEGIYDGETTYKKLKRHGDFGIGTFNGLDGEMIGLEGKFYQIKADGIAYLVDDSMKTPFATVTFFESDKSALLEKIENYDQLKKYLDKLLPTKNIFYAIKIEGTFEYIKTRSVPKQSKPYPLLVEVVKTQSIFEFHNVKGTIAGFWCPGYVEGVNVPGYHLHFITEDRKAGGHLLECHLQNARLDIDYTSEFYMVLLKSDKFYKTDLTQKKQKELERVEK